MKISETQRKILVNAREGKRVFQPCGWSESGGWSASTVSCFRKGLLNAGTKEAPLGTLTETGKAALDAWEGRK